MSDFCQRFHFFWMKLFLLGSILFEIPSASRYGRHSGMVVVLSSLTDVYMAVNSRWLNFFSTITDRFSYMTLVPYGAMGSIATLYALYKVGPETVPANLLSILILPWHLFRIFCICLCIIYYFCVCVSVFILCISGIFLESDLWTTPPCFKNVQKKFFSLFWIIKSI